MESFQEYMDRTYRPKWRNQGLLLGAIFACIIAAFLGFVLW